MTPLQYSSTDPEGTTKEQLSLELIRARKMQIVHGDARAADLEGTDGQLCEDGRRVKGNRAKLTQHSCGADVYGDAYRFVHKNGCWFLRGVESSGD